MEPSSIQDVPALHEKRPIPLRVGFLQRMAPCFLAFLASFCVMVVELVASRLIAREVGNSLYTWTSVIGVVLAGITVGNLLGGRLADRLNPRMLLSALFILAAVACALVPAFNVLVGKIELEKFDSWAARIAAHVGLVFFPSSLILGLIGPVVAKMALDQGTATGRTVGNVYAWGALGSILGTFTTGFFLIPRMGTNSILLYVGGLLAVVGFVIRPFFAWPLFLVFFVGCFFSYRQLGTGLFEWSLARGWPFVHERIKKDWVYACESQYSFIKIERSTDDDGEESRELILDHLIHAYFPKDITRLEYDYEEIYAAVTHRYLKERKDLRALFLGGGGYIFPRYLRAYWPESRLEVAEIDPGVTRAVLTAFGLQPEDVHIDGDPGFLDGIPDRVHLRDFEEGDDTPKAAEAEPEKKKDPGETDPGAEGGEEEPEEESIPDPRGAPWVVPPVRPIEVYHLDARQHVEDLVRKKRSGAPFEPLDVIYGDAFNHYSVPFHLVTREFNEKLKELLRPETGLYLINVIDIYDSGLFIGAIYNTLLEVFPHVYVLPNNKEGPDEDEDARETFIAIGALRELDLSDLAKEIGKDELEASVLGEEHLRNLVERSRGIVLTDDYSPVENLLEPVIRLSR